MNTSHNEPLPQRCSHMLLSQMHNLHCPLTGALITQACSAHYVTGPYHMPHFYDLCSSPYIIRVVKWREMRWVGQVAHTQKKRNLYAAFTRKPEGRSLLGKPNCRLVSSGSGYGKVVSSCEHSDKTLGYIKMWWTLQPLEQLWASQGLCSMELLYKNMYTYRPGKHNYLTLSGLEQECTQVLAGWGKEMSVWCPAVLEQHISYFVFILHFKQINIIKQYKREIQTSVALLF